MPPSRPARANPIRAAIFDPGTAVSAAAVGPGAIIRPAWSASSPQTPVRKSTLPKSIAPKPA